MLYFRCLSFYSPLRAYNRRKQEVHFPPEASHTASHGCIFGLIERSCILPFIKLTENPHKTPRPRLMPQTKNAQSEGIHAVKRQIKEKKRGNTKEPRRPKNRHSTAITKKNTLIIRKTPEKKIVKREAMPQKKFMWICRRSRQRKHRRDP